MLKLITSAQARLNSLRVDEDGNAAEYGLIIALIAVVIIGGLTALGVALAANFNQIAGALCSERPNTRARSSVCAPRTVASLVRTS